MEGSCEYVEQALRENRQVVILHPVGWGEAKISST
jgi:hypothetical protein